jgi:hypothetical protein
MLTDSYRLCGAGFVIGVVEGSRKLVNGSPMFREMTTTSKKNPLPVSQLRKHRRIQKEKLERHNNNNNGIHLPRALNIRHKLCGNLLPFT